MQPPQSRHPDGSHADAERYNYNRFEPHILVKEAKLIRHPEGPHPGERAPDFLLKDTQGKAWRLRDLKGRPVVLLSGNGSCPMTQGNLPGLQSLFQEYEEVCQWLMLYVREAHPGERFPSHKSYQQKRDQAEYFRQDTATPWPVLVDDLDGCTHKRYGLVPNFAVLIDANGCVSFVGEIFHAPSLRKALEQLFKKNQRGTVAEGEDRSPHVLGAAVYGWEGIERGGHFSQRDFMVRMPILAMSLRAGHKMRPILGPIASRSKPLPPIAKAALGLGAAAVIGVLAHRLLRSRHH